MVVRGFTQKLQKQLIQDQLENIQTIFVEQNIKIDNNIKKLIKLSLEKSLTATLETESSTSQKKERKPSAYNIFFKERQEKYKHIQNVGERAKKIGEEWSKMSDAEKKKFAPKAK